MSRMESRGGDTSPIHQPRQSRTHSVGLPARTSLLPEPPPTGIDGAPPLPRRHSATPTVAPPPVPLRAPAIPKRSKNERPIPIQKSTARPESSKGQDRNSSCVPNIPKIPPASWYHPSDNGKLIDLDSCRKADYSLAFVNDKSVADVVEPKDFAANFEKKEQTPFEELEKRLHESKRTGELETAGRTDKRQQRGSIVQSDSIRLIEDLSSSRGGSKYDDLQTASRDLEKRLRDDDQEPGPRNPKRDKLEKLPKATQTNLPPPLSVIAQSPVPKPMSVRQDSNVSSDSFSQTSSPSYTSKTMEAPLLPYKHANGRIPGRALAPEPENPPGSPITKSISTPAGLQTIVRFHSGSNMSLHHKIIRDMRRPSSHYVTRGRLRFRFAQVLVNAIALLAIAGGLAAYFKSYPAYTVRFENKTLYSKDIVMAPELIRPMIVQKNPAPGVCLPVIVSFCQYHKIPYNFTVFPNYMGNFGQRDAQHELELHNSIVDVRCYELVALFLCSVFVPKCGSQGQVVRPCRSLCFQTKRRCGFFFVLFGLTLPDYLECDLFPENADPDKCVGHREVIEAAKKADNPVCTSGFQCDGSRCIPVDWHCDGHVDCADQTDEIDCGECAPTTPSTNDDKGEKNSPLEVLIHCGEKRCMSSSHICDGNMDCPWGQDERNCLRLSERNGDVGSGRLEVFHAEKGRFLPACVTHWEPTSAQTVCALLGYTIANSSSLSIKGGNVTLTKPRVETWQLWRLAQNRNNLLKEFQECADQEVHSTVDLTCSAYGCGRRPRIYGNDKARTRIVGGIEATPGDWPFLAGLLGGPEQVFYCAGVLIADQWVLTASHCVGNFSHSEVSGWTIQLGITRRHSHTYLGQKVKVKRVIPHPNYNLGIAHDNDVALFQLESRVQFHEHLRPVCLPTADTDLIPGTICTVIGWGKKEDTDDSEYEPAVNEVRVPVLDRETCNVWLEHKELNVTDGMICAGYQEGGKDACQGDSGGPLLCQDKRDKERWFVGGIVSWGIKCAFPKLPGVYAYVPKYVPWIYREIAKYSEKDEG